MLWLYWIDADQSQGLQSIAERLSNSGITTMFACLFAKFSCMNAALLYSLLFSKYSYHHKYGQGGSE